MVSAPIVKPSIGQVEKVPIHWLGRHSIEKSWQQIIDHGRLHSQVGAAQHYYQHWSHLFKQRFRCEWKVIATSITYLSFRTKRYLIALKYRLWQPTWTSQRTKSASYSSGLAFKKLYQKSWQIHHQIMLSLLFPHLYSSLKPTPTRQSSLPLSFAPSNLRPSTTRTKTSTL